MLIKKLFKVTGLSQFEYGQLQHNIQVGTKLLLKPQPENRYDANALGIYFGGDFIRSPSIGWIPKSDNPPLAGLLNYLKQDKLYVTVTKHTPDTITKHKSELLVQVVIDTGGYEFGNIHVKRVLEQGFTVVVGGTEFKTIDEFNKYVNTASTVAVNPLNFSTKASNVSIGGGGGASTLHFASPLSKETVNSIKKQLKEESIMTKIVDTNKTIATQAAFNEAGRIFLNQVTKAVQKQAPLMVKGYVDTPAGKLLLANATVLAVQHFRGSDVRLNRLANAALGQAYQEMYKAFDIEKFIEGFLTNESIKTALNAVAEEE